MKKLVIMAALAVAAVAASAQVTGFTKYDYDRANDNQGPWRSQHEVAVGAAVKTQYGVFDGAVLGRQLVTNARDNNVGFELGYSNSVSLGKNALAPTAGDYTLTGRVAYGQMNGVNAPIGGFTGNSSYLSLGAEAGLPVSEKASLFVGYRHRMGLNGDTPTQNRYTAGVDYAFTKKVSLRAGLAHTRQNGITYNGVTTALNVTF